MASGIVLHRTVFMERTSDGYFRFSDWALVTTRLGTMAEPFTTRTCGLGDGGVTFDATDDLALISNIKNINSDLLPTMLSGGGPSYHGGPLMPRTGR